MRIEVTKEDICMGQRGLGQYCPVASAIRRAIGGEVHVGKFTVIILRGGYGGDVEFLPIPLPITAFIEKFDQGEPVEPFTFILKGV